MVRKFVEAEPEKFETDKELSVVRLVEDQKPKRRYQSWLPAMLVGTSLGIAIAFGGIWLTSRPTQPKPTQPSKTQAPSMSVTVASVENTRIARKLSVTGTVAARELIAVLPQITGLQIEQILVDEGDFVKAGQVMAVLDNSVLQTQINGAKAEIESNQAVVRQRQAALAQNQASLAEAERTLERNRQLANAGAISRQEFDARATEAATAREDVQVASADINSAQANVRSSTARLQQLQTQLGQTFVRAPAAGIVAEKNIEIGNVAANQQLFSIIRDGKLELQAQVPAVQLPQVQIGALAKITSDSDRRVNLQGRVREIAPLVNAQNRQAIVKINLPNTTLLRPGVFARAAITTNTVPGIAIPAKAVVPQPDGTSNVFVLTNEGKVQARPVEVGEILNDGRVEIKNNLKAGDRVIVAGAGYLKDGDRVRVVKNSE